ncbi:hypothetical protein [Microbacterium jiangjiandongii]|uniref:hypothetical protein n=1 Tax=Microbacterium jiangjiandongii TaxID=3049071 RepID=UPI00214B0BE9|nr:hypothetical protein [Microbacterium sp. zg.Y843]MCR2816605.1 hypothetical protein [Microbacterium sp. zg.Y843]
MARPDFETFLTRARDRVTASRRDAGYARSRDGEVADLYGTAAAVGILIALGDRPTGAEAESTAGAVQSFKTADGWYADPTHGRMHRAATALTTLAALGRRPEAPAALRPLLRADAAAPFLTGLDWDQPWPTSHEAAGLLAIGIVSDDGEDATRRTWRERYLGWLDDHADENTGLWLGGRMGRLDEDPGLFGNLGCSFHLHFLYEHLGRAWPHEAGVVDTGLALLRQGTTVLPEADAEPSGWGFRQLDWAYSVGRAARAGHRTTEVRSELEQLAARAAVAFSHPDAAEGDLHVVQARVGLIAELAQQIPDAIDTGGVSLTSIVDARPFI